MFERRLKIFLGLLFVPTLLLLGRTMQVQIFQRADWEDEAMRMMRDAERTATVRGRILDTRGRVIAEDIPSIDVCVDFRAIGREPDAKWLRTISINRLDARTARQWRRRPLDDRRALLGEEIDLAKGQVRQMWQMLARISDSSADEMDEIRHSILHRVEMQRRYVWYNKFRAARERYENRQPTGAWLSWLLDDSSSAPELDSFDVTVAEQSAPHVILRAINAETRNTLGKRLEECPGLSLLPSTDRYYPYGQVACHSIGRLSRVSREDLELDAALGLDELKRSLPNDLVGRTGIEAIAELSLRGSRGRVERSLGDDGTILERKVAIPGADVRTTLDIELQKEIEDLFAHGKVEDHNGKVIDVYPMHGAAVVIDLSGGEVRALVSYPTYDLNTIDENYEQLQSDDRNLPLFNRATQDTLEPGSTIKPVVGIGAITQGTVKVDEGIECTGYLVLGKQKFRFGRCWVASKFERVLKANGLSVAHHPVPSYAPHPTGFLTFADALERSCNVYFEVLADKLGIDGLTWWYQRFGLGRPTGIGLPEASGRLPSSYRGNHRQMAACFAGIGQGSVAATPIQMANVAATIARDGVWQRPLLFPAGTVLPPRRASTTVPSDDEDEPAIERGDRFRVPAAPEALAAAREGMDRVVNSPAGTGTRLRVNGLHVAGKTGTAQAAKFTIYQRDERGQILRDENGRPRRLTLDPGTDAAPLADLPWYRAHGEDGSELSHAWYIGFAPADHPRIAFCVLVEYGGSGGATAAPIARDLLEACIRHGYLARSN